MIRPGDVILTLGTDKFVEGIAYATKGKYSHSMLVASDYQLFEADDEGVGYSDTAGNGGILIGNGTFRRVLAMRDCVDVRVLSHPALKEKTSEEIEMAIAKIVKPWEGDAYSDYRRLFEPLKVSGRPLSWIKAVLAIYQWGERRGGPGMFCSEVVARVFEALECDHGFANASLFAAKRCASLVHPGHIAHSRLQTVTGAVGFSTGLPDGFKIKWDSLSWNRRNPTIWARQMKQIKDINYSILVASAKLREKSLSDHRLSAAQLEHEVRKLIETARELKALRAEARLNGLLVAMERLLLKMEKFYEEGRSDVVEYWQMSVSKSEIGWDVREAQVDLMEEYCQPGQPTYESIKKVIAKERAEILRLRGPAMQSLKDALRQWQDHFPAEESSPC